ncbi:hypothetical protein KW805_03685 [Candidatus Pacearchaeota archaeon]|nr:hypothetical protein [Candidatus Pacearchaeota archaeon]
MKILYGVFDWGLGHATRSISLINALLKKKHKVHIVTTGRALKILERSFGKKCIYYDIDPKGIPLSITPFFTINYMLSTPRMILGLWRSRKQIRDIIYREHFDKVISDARVDVYDKKDNSYIINHQIRFKTFFGARIIGEFILSMFMKRYKYLIVPDFEEPNLSGVLSHNTLFSSAKRIKYIGILSHLRKRHGREDIDYLISLTGPEQYRISLEKSILPQLSSLNGKIVVAGGKPEEEKEITYGKITFYSHLTTEKQEEIMNRAKFIISRSGYTTVMEIVELGKKKVLFIPTPGQTEQEYLANLYERRGLFHHVHQRKIDLKNDIEKSKGFKGFTPPWKTKETIEKFMQVVFSS